ncbi:MAG: DMT family transporter, partial [Ruminococcaceae bacterium]|nr:DMT family transporter [Oscillospiraceae bacterium]
TGLLSLLLLGVFHTGFMYVLYFGTLPHLSGREVAMLSYLDPLVSVFLSFLVLHEQIGWQQLLGGATLLAFTVIGELALPKKPTEEIKTLR